MLARFCYYLYHLRRCLSSRSFLTLTNSLNLLNFVMKEFTVQSKDIKVKILESYTTVEDLLVFLF